MQVSEKMKTVGYYAIAVPALVSLGVVLMTFGVQLPGPLELYGMQLSYVGTVAVLAALVGTGFGYVRYEYDRVRWAGGTVMYAFLGGFHGFCQAMAWINDNELIATFAATVVSGFGLAVVANITSTLYIRYGIATAAVYSVVMATVLNPVHGLAIAGILGVVATLAWLCRMVYLGIRVSRSKALESTQEQPNPAG